MLEVGLQMLHEVEVQTQPGFQHLLQPGSCPSALFLKLPLHLCSWQNCCHFKNIPFTCTFVPIFFPNGNAFLPLSLLWFYSAITSSTKLSPLTQKAVSPTPMKLSSRAYNAHITHQAMLFFQQEPTDGLACTWLTLWPNSVLQYITTLVIAQRLPLLHCNPWEWFAN